MFKSILPFAAHHIDQAKSRVSGNALVLQVESTEVTCHNVTLKAGRPDGFPVLEGSWDPRPFFTEANGLRFLEEAARRIRALASQSHRSIDYVAMTLPGTVEGTSTIEGSSRLGITTEVNVATECKRLGAPPTYVFHDVECLAIGEALSGVIPTDESGVPAHQTFAYILVDEGVGASLFIDGRPYHGAGVAGHIGRLVMEPSGAFNPTFTSRGTLEGFAARPWISQNVVNEYLAERNKVGAISAAANPFRAAVDAAANSGSVHGLSFKQLAEGMTLRDPIATGVLQDAAHYLSIAINAVITIMNPPLIMLGGEVFSEIPEFAEMVMSHARRNAWAGSWNETTIHISTRGRHTQIAGAAHLLVGAIALGQ